MSTYNLNDTDNQTTFAPIPGGIYCLETRVKPGGVGDDGLLTLARNLRTCHLNLEFTVVGGEYNGRKLWDIITIEFDETDSDLLPSLDQAQLEKFRRAVQIGLSRFRALVESAHGIAGNDKSDHARQIRQIGLAGLDGLRPVAKVGIKKGTDGYSDKNNVAYFITAEMREWPGLPPQDDDAPAGPKEPRTPPPRPLPALRDELSDEVPF